MERRGHFVRLMFLLSFQKRGEKISYCVGNHYLTNYSDFDTGGKNACMWYKLKICFQLKGWLRRLRGRGTWKVIRKSNEGWKTSIVLLTKKKNLGRIFFFFCHFYAFFYCLFLKENNQQFQIRFTWKFKFFLLKWCYNLVAQMSSVLKVIYRT